MASTPHFDGPRLIRPEELRASRRLWDLCFGGLHLPETEPEEPETKETEPAEHLSYETCVISAGGLPVSQMGILYKRLRIHNSLVRTGSIGGVCTHPDYRGFGLATLLLEYCAQRLVKGGARLMVISGGRGLYTRAGCVPMGRFAAFSIRPGPSRRAEAAATRQVRLREAGPADAALCSRLYQQEAVHFVRPEIIFLERLQPHPIGFQAEEFVVEMHGQDAAYLMLSVPWQYARQPGAGIRDIAEYAGSRAALHGAILAAADQLQLRELQAPVAWQDSALIQLLKASELSPTWSGLPGHTNRVIDLAGMMADLRPYFEARLPAALRRGLRFGQAGPLLAGTGLDSYSILRGKDRLDLDGASMTRLVMGDPGHPSQTVVAPGALAEIIPALFPLPSFFTGLDYH